MALEARDVVGTWQLERWEVRRDDGSRSWPLGPRPQGIVIYGADGWMSLTMMAGDRPPLSADNARVAPEAERAAAFNGCFAYACAWRVVDGAIEHDVRVAHNPSMVGTRQRREASVDGSILTIVTGSAASGGRHELAWRRPSGPDGPVDVGAGQF